MVLSALILSLFLGYAAAAPTWQNLANPNIDSADLVKALEEARDLAPKSVQKDGLVLLVRTFDGKTLVEMQTRGDTDKHTVMMVGSGGKFIGGITLLKCMTETSLEFNSTAREILGWTGPAADATIDMLGAYVAGIEESIADCQHTPFKTLEKCVDTLDPNTKMHGPPGTTFEYELFATEPAIIARMCEVASGKSFSAHFEEMKEILGIRRREVEYGWYRRNPNIGGALHITASAFAKFLDLVAHKGMFVSPNKNLTRRIIREDYVERMRHNPYGHLAPVYGENGVETPPNAVAGKREWNYGWLSILYCGTDVVGKIGFAHVDVCDKIGHGGAFGFTNWVDWTNQYYGTIFTESSFAQGADAVAWTSSARTILEPVLLRMLADVQADGTTWAPTSTPVWTPIPPREGLKPGTKFLLWTAFFFMAVAVLLWFLKKAFGVSKAVFCAPLMCCLEKKSADDDEKALAGAQDEADGAATSEAATTPDSEVP